MLINKKTLIKITGSLSLLITSQLTFAEQKVCVSNHSLPKHCQAGDIVVVRPAKVALVCDFDKQIIELRPSEKAIEFLCVYTGKVLPIKHGPKPPPKRNSYKEKKKKKSKIPFFK